MHEKTVSEYNISRKAIEFGLQKQSTLSPDCKRCQYKFACNGGCPKHRFERSPSGHPNHNYFCQGYKYFFQHSAKYMKEMRRLLSVGRFADEIMWSLAYQETGNTINGVSQIHKPRMTKKRAPIIGRNQPCPCKSGVKYKHCCGGKR
ncbi:SPASM domain-containing protein [Photobacterium sp. DNB22_13_2]